MAAATQIDAQGRRQAVSRDHRYEEDASDAQPVYGWGLSDLHEAAQAPR